MRSLDRRALAALDLRGETKDRKCRQIQIRIGQPRRIRKRGKAAAHSLISLSMSGLGINKFDVSGENNFQALSLAIAYVGERLRTFKRKGGIIYIGEIRETNLFPVEAYFSPFSSSTVKKGRRNRG
jgi:hypothetical protein